MNKMHFFDAYGNQEWLVEARVPSAHKRWLRNRIEECKAESARITQSILDGSLFDDSTAPSESSPYPYHIRNLFAERCVYIHSVPPTCTRACLLRFLQPFEGFQTAYFGDVFHCPPTELNRPVYVLFDSRGHTEAAFKRMVAVHVPLIDTESLGLAGLKQEESPSAGNATFILLCSLWRQMGRPPVLAAAANAANRVEKDLAQTKRVLGALETYWVGIGSRYHPGRRYRNNCGSGAMGQNGTMGEG